MRTGKRGEDASGAVGAVNLARAAVERLDFVFKRRERLARGGRCAPRLTKVERKSRGGAEEAGDRLHERVEQKMSKRKLVERPSAQADRRIHVRT